MTAITHIQAEALVAASTMSSVSSLDCLAMAREARKHAQAFRRSVAEFDKINIDKIFDELREMRASVAT